MQETDKEIFEKDAKDYLPVFNRYKIVLDHGEGAYLWDNNGKKYLDFLGGIAVNVLGHDYGPLVTAISEQAKKLIHCSNLYYTQARRLKIRVKGEDGKMYLPHTLNNTVVAPPRMLIAFLENNLQADGSVLIPKVLQPYMGGKTVLIPKK